MTENKMKQFRQLKEKHPDALLLFRCGNLYESLEEDAAAVSKVCGLTVRHGTDGTRSAAFPHFNLDTYLPKLIRAGHRIAICDDLK